MRHSASGELKRPAGPQKGLSAIAPGGNGTSQGVPVGVPAPVAVRACGAAPQKTDEHLLSASVHTFWPKNLHSTYFWMSKPYPIPYFAAYSPEPVLYARPGRGRSRRAGAARDWLASWARGMERGSRSEPTRRRSRQTIFGSTRAARRPHLSSPPTKQEQINSQSTALCATPR